MRNGHRVVHVKELHGEWKGQGGFRTTAMAWAMEIGTDDDRDLAEARS